jgi:hypothetical protein
MRSHDKNCDFALSAHPHSWLLVADNLYEQSVALRTKIGDGKLTQIDGDGKVTGEWALPNRSTFLLAGFALENAIKAFLVYENPGWVSNGTLAKPLRSHHLIRLSAKSLLIPWPKRSIPILGEFERGLESWARYPCALSATESESEQNLTDPLWENYLELMRAYGKKLMELLEKGWNGPHGVEGYFKFGGGFLGATK